MSKLYHITHIRNLPSIIEHDGILCDSGMSTNNLEHVGIAHRHIKARRARTIVPTGQKGTLADYVPFYFAPRSPMLYAINTGYVESYSEGQGAVLHLVISVEGILSKKLPIFFVGDNENIPYSASGLSGSGYDRYT